MPRLIRTVDDIMRERQRGTYFLQFGSPLDPRSDASDKWLQLHLEWLASYCVAHEPAAPRGWLSGDPRCMAVYFDEKQTDQLIDVYAQQFEDKEGRSFEPKYYQMGLLIYKSWLRSIADDRFEENLEW